MRLSDSALKALGDGGPAERATSFVTEKLFELWRARHPAWCVIEDADLSVGGQPLIEIPAVEIGSLTVGPVWFTRRPNRNFHEYMSSMMDRRVEGALGGSLLRHFAATVDYPAGRAAFQLE